MNIKTSIIIPVYNTKEYLCECLDSVINQTQREIEIILIDDGSTDGSLDILMDYRRKFNNIIVLQQENRKQGSARNAGMAIAKGKYICFADSDDYLDMKALDILYDHAEHNKLDTLLFDAKAFQDGDIEITNVNEQYDRSTIGIDTTRIWTGIEYLEQYYDKGGMYVNSYLMYYSKEFLDKNNFYFQEEVFFEDNEFAIKAYMKSKRMMYLPLKLYFRRYRSNSTVTSQYEMPHLLGRFVTSRLIWKHMIEDHNSCEKKKAVRSFLSQTIKYIYRTWKETQYIDGFQLSAKIVEFINEYEKSSPHLFFSNLDMRLSFQLQTVLDLIMKQKEELNLEDISVNKINVLYSRINIWNKNYINKRNEWLDIKNSNKSICIYGTGEIAIELFQCFKKENNEKIEINLIFADSHAKADKSDFYGCLLIPITQLEKYDIDKVIIASTKYEGEMSQRLRELYGNKYIYFTYRQLAHRIIPLEEMNEYYKQVL